MRQTIALTDEDQDVLMLMLGYATAGAMGNGNTALANAFLRVMNAILSQVGGVPYESLEVLDAKVKSRFG